MRQSFPRSLVQIHYHDRIGGVRRTMETYALAFTAAAGRGAPNILICRKCTGWDVGGCVTVDLPGADYHAFRTRQACQAEIERLAGKLEGFLTAQSLRFPVAVVGHNLNLGKNPALAAAFTLCARKLGGAPGRFRFFSMMHDFAEAGRVDVMASLRKSGLQDRSFLPELYAAGVPVHYIVPNLFNAAVTGLPPENLTVLPHPVEVCHHTTIMDTTEFRAHLGKLAKLDGLRFDTKKKLYCFPSRMIYRKNGLEALLLATIFFDGALLIGACGNAAADRTRFSALLRLSREYGLPLSSDPSRLPELIKKKIPYADPFKPWYPLMDVVISTSLSEGYGYSLMEPWVFGVPVIGRYPSGVDLPSSLTAGLYTRLSVPVSWVSLSRCYEYFSKAYTGAFGRRYISARSFAAWFIRNDTVDFGMLETGVQTTIISRIMRSDADRVFLKTLQGFGVNPGGHLEDRITPAVLRNACAAVTGRRHRVFDKLFVKCLQQRPRTVPHGWCHRPGDWYRKADHFFPLVPSACR